VCVPFLSRFSKSGRFVPPTESRRSRQSVGTHGPRPFTPSMAPMGDKPAGGCARWVPWYPKQTVTPSLVTLGAMAPNSLTTSAGTIVPSAGGALVGNFGANWPQLFYNLVEYHGRQPAGRTDRSQSPRPAEQVRYQKGTALPPSAAFWCVSRSGSGAVGYESVSTGSFPRRTSR